MFLENDDVFNVQMWKKCENEDSNDLHYLIYPHTEQFRPMGINREIKAMKIERNNLDQLLKMFSEFSQSIKNHINLFMQKQVSPLVMKIFHLFSMI